MTDVNASVVRIQLSWANGSIEGVLNDSPTADKVARILPHCATANTWGQEIYFSVPAESVLDKNPQTVVDPGTICFWVQGSSIAIPYGPTPISEGGECRLVTAVNVIGKLDGDPRLLASLEDGETVTLETVAPDGL